MSEICALSLVEQLREAARINAKRCGLGHDDMLDWTAADEMDRLESIVAKDARYFTAIKENNNATEWIRGLANDAIAEQQSGGG